MNCTVYYNCYAMVGWFRGQGKKGVCIGKKMHCGPMLMDIIIERVSGSLTMVYDTHEIIEYFADAQTVNVIPLLSPPTWHQYEASVAVC